MPGSAVMHESPSTTWEGVAGYIARRSAHFWLRGRHIYQANWKGLSPPAWMGRIRAPNCRGGVKTINDARQNLDFVVWWPALWDPLARI